MTNLQKRILTSIIILPLSIFFILKGGKFLTFFLIFVLFAGIHELYSVFKKTKSILFLSSIFTVQIIEHDKYNDILENIIIYKNLKDTCIIKFKIQILIQIGKKKI